MKFTFLVDNGNILSILRISLHKTPFTQSKKRHTDTQLYSSFATKTPKPL